MEVDRTRTSENFAARCPDCGNFHLHAVHCPNPEPLPMYARRPDPVRCPDCSAIYPHAHASGCPIVASRYLIPPQVDMPLDEALSEEDLEVKL